MALNSSITSPNFLTVTTGTTTVNPNDLILAPGFGTTVDPNWYTTTVNTYPSLIKHTKYEVHCRQCNALITTLYDVEIHDWLGSFPSSLCKTCYKLAQLKQ